MNSLLSLITFLPLVGALILLFVPGGDSGKEFSRWVALIVTTITFALTLLMWSRFDNSNPGFQFVENYEWIG